MSRSRQSQLFSAADAPTDWELAAEGDRLVAQVVFNRPLESPYSYLVPEPLREVIQPGTRVRVPLGRGDTVTTGYCVGLSGDSPTHRRLKSLLEVLDREPLLTPGMLQLTRWIGERYLCSWGQVLESVIPAGVKRQSGTRTITTLQLADGLDLDALKLTTRQKTVLSALQQANGPLSATALADAAGCGPSPIETLRKRGILTAQRERSDVVEAEHAPVEKQEDLQLNTEQKVCLDRILAALREQAHRTFLMHGVTGSGKTEVYIQAIREVVSYGKQAIVLVPEISLTPQTIRRFRARFESVAVLHSHLSDADRHWHWQQIAQGRVQVVVGARSAVFAPTPRLGLIVIDEEHENTFKQQTTPRYHAREVARERARRESVPLILGSATPTLESLWRTRQGADELLTLKARVAQRPLPRVTLVDTRNDPLISKGHAVGRALGEAIRRALADNGQVILFLNLRGYSPVLWCPRCAAVKCPDCDISLTWHRDRGQLLCHSCEYTLPPPERCPHCGQPGLRYLGTGTQRLEADCRTKFPDARLLRMDSDSMRAPGSHDVALDRFRSGNVDILLGTQMIAKGLDFPNVTLVGVVDADTLLHQPDLRASERTFQLIAQVAGRTGRGSREGRVLVQTMSPEEPVIQLAAQHDYNRFAELELEHRRATASPPFTALARVVLRSLQEAAVKEEARRLAESLRSVAAGASGLRILGPAPAPLVRLRKFFRYHLQIQGADPKEIERVWQQTAARFDFSKDVEVTIDVDPVDFR